MLNFGFFCRKFIVESEKSEFWEFPELWVFPYFSMGALVFEKYETRKQRTVGSSNIDTPVLGGGASENLVFTCFYRYAGIGRRIYQYAGIGGTCRFRYCFLKWKVYRMYWKEKLLVFRYKFTCWNRYVTVSSPNVDTPFLKLTTKI